MRISMHRRDRIENEITRRVLYVRNHFGNVNFTFTKHTCTVHVYDFKIQKFKLRNEAIQCKTQGI